MDEWREETLKMVTVLMAFYSGNRYIRQRLGSIPAQDKEDIHIPVSDNCSSDSSRGLLKEYKTSRGDRVPVLSRKEPFGGAAAHSLRLLKLMADTAHGPEEQPQHGNLLPEYEMTKSQLAHLGRPAEADYFMLSDRDDVWMSQKARMLSNKMKEMERKPGRGSVLPLVHSDLTMANEALWLIVNSFLRYQKISPERTSLSQLLVQSNVTGGAVMVSRNMLSHLKEIPGVYLMHNVWLALIASCFGRIRWVDRPLYYYRQHGGNTLGAEKRGSLDSVRTRVKNGSSVRENYKRMFGQADSFYHMFYSHLNREQRETLEAFIRPPRCGRLGKMGLITKYGFTKNTLVRTLGQILFVGD